MAFWEVSQCYFSHSLLVMSYNGYNQASGWYRFKGMIIRLNILMME